MTRQAFRLLVVGASAATLYMMPVLAQAQKVQGIVVTNKSGQLTIKTPHGNRTYSLSPSARIRSISGALGGQKEVVPASALLPGLPVTIEADGHVARGVDYKAKDYKTAAQIQAGVEETSRRSEEMRTAYSRMGDWDIRAEENIFFKTGSAVMNSTDRQKLLEIAGKATTHKGYVVSVLGYADPRGNAAANERLSNRRAQTVINYLKQSGKLLPARVLSASAMGEMNIPVDRPGSEAYQNARRVTIRVLTSAAHLKR